MSFVVIAVLQEKGGTRKTYTCAHLYPWLKSEGYESTLVDIDISAGHLSVLYPDECTRLTLDDDGVVEIRKLVSERRNLILDFGANSSSAFYTHVDSNANLAQLVAENGGKLVIVTPIEDAPKGRYYALKYREVYPTAQVIAARPLINGNTPPTVPDAFRRDMYFDIPEISGRLLRAYNQEYLTLDRLCTQNTSLGIWAKVELQRLYAEFNRVRHVLLPNS